MNISKKRTIKLIEGRERIHKIGRIIKDMKLKGDDVPQELRIRSKNIYIGSSK